MLLCVNNIVSQNILYKTLEANIDSLKEKFQIINNPNVPIIYKDEANIYIINKLENILKSPMSIDLKFDSLKYLSVLKADNSLLKIYTWQVIGKDRAKYYGFIQTVNKRNKITLTKLNDESEYNSKDADKQLFDNDNWYGALYYKLITFKIKKSNPYYILLGINVNDKITNKKIIETLSFSKKNKPVFGADLFKIESVKQKRIIFEYSDFVTMSLRFDEKLKAIVFDHLSPSDPSLKGKYMYYGPDFSYDAFIIKKKKWVLFENINPKNPKQFDVKIKRTPEMQLKKTDNKK